ncbi:MAG: hypothetical protein GY941_19860 [Planctomycetes bacterium]|nr:hypothetical protein [Planctomycetota bacterium]
MLEETYASRSEIPAGFAHLYKDVDDGTVILMGSREIKSATDVEKVQTALRNERKEHKATKVALGKFDGLEPDEVNEKLDEYDALKLQVEQGTDETKIEALVESRVKAKTAPLERMIKTLTEENATASTSLGEYKTRENNRTIVEAVREVALKEKLNNGGMADAEFMAPHIFEIPEGGGEPVTKAGVHGITEGVTADVWLSEQLESRPNWMAESVLAGSKGGKGGTFNNNNPFSKANWNMTEQGRALVADRAKAEKMAAAAGTTIGGPMPEK